jgi:hypothetical protein
MSEGARKVLTGTYKISSVTMCHLQFYSSSPVTALKGPQNTSHTYEYMKRTAPLCHSTLMSSGGPHVLQRFYRSSTFKFYRGPLHSAIALSLNDSGQGWARRQIQEKTQQAGRRGPSSLTIPCLVFNQVALSPSS